MKVLLVCIGCSLLLFLLIDGLSVLHHINHGYDDDVIDPREEEIVRLRKQLEEERAKNSSLASQLYTTQHKLDMANGMLNHKDKKK